MVTLIKFNFLILIFMKKFLVLFLSIFLLLSCSEKVEENISNEEVTKQEETIEKIKVISSIVPLSSISNYIWWEYVDVENLVPSGVSPHGFDLSPKQMIEISNSDIIISLGLDHIDWFLDKAIWDKNNLIVSNWIELIDWSEHDHHDEHEEEHHDDEHHNDHDEHEEEHHDEHEDDHSKDPHIWNSPENAILIAEKVKNEFSSFMPNKKSEFEKNYKKFEEELNLIVSDFKESIKEKNQAWFIVYHDAHNYLFSYLNIDTLKKIVFKSSVLDDSNTKQLKEIVDKIKEYNVKVSFKEPQFDDSNIKKLASEYGLNILVLDPLWTDISSNWYIDNLKNNLESLKYIYE